MGSALCTSYSSQADGILLQSAGFKSETNQNSQNMLKETGEVLGRNEASKMTGKEPVATKKN